MGSGLAYKIVNNRNDRVNIPNLKSGGDAYDNFDLQMYSYRASTPDQAKSDVQAYSGRMLQKTYGSASVTPVIAEPLHGNLIQELNVQDAANAASWSITQGVKAGDSVFGDRAVTFTSVPAYLADADYIRTACDSKKHTGEEAVITVSQNAEVLIGLDSRLNDARYPAWLSGWEKTGDIASDNGDPNVTYELYRKTVQAGGSVTIGMIAQSSCVNVIAAVIPAKIQGDVNADGSFNIADAAALMRYLLADGTLADWQTGDFDGNGRLNAIDLTLMKRALMRIS